MKAVDLHHLSIRNTFDLPEVETIPLELPDMDEETRVQPVPLYHVVLLDDNDHTYDYVVEMLSQLFGHSLITAYEMACEVDSTGRVIVGTMHRERAEVKRDQIHAFGPDWRLERSDGSMAAVLEAVEE